MLHEFLDANRDDLIARCRTKVASRPAPQVIGEELEYGVPLFLDQLIKTLQLEQISDFVESTKVSGSSDGDTAALSEIGESATRHGRELLDGGFTVEQVVHDYGDLCQSITDLASERGDPITVNEFRTLNRCLDNGIADAVAGYFYQHDSEQASRHADQLNERLGFFAHELRNHLSTATLAVSVLKTGSIGISGATGAVLDRSLVGLRTLIDRSLAEVRLQAGKAAHDQLFSLAAFVSEVKVSATLEAQIRGCTLRVFEVDSELALNADRDLLLGALGNLLQNAFKFTKPHSEVTLKAYGSGNRILIEVSDQCGGLSAGVAQKMFAPFAQSHEDKSGLGLGLSITRRSVEAQGGILGVRDTPGIGCTFTLDLPRHAMVA